MLGRIVKILSLSKGIEIGIIGKISLSWEKRYFHFHCTTFLSKVIAETKSEYFSKIGSFRKRVVIFYDARRNFDYDAFFTVLQYKTVKLCLKMLNGTISH